jgi:hypothetical protein
MSLEELAYESARFLREQTLERMLDLVQFRAAVRCGAFRPVRMRAGGVHFWIEGQLAGKGKPQPEESMVLCTSREKRHRYFSQSSGSAGTVMEDGCADSGDRYDELASGSCEVRARLAA